MNARIEHIKKSFGNTQIFDDLTFDFSRVGMYYIKGESGIGKTTLLHIIAGIEPYDEGKRDVDEALLISSLFQNFELIPELTVKENILLLQELQQEDCLLDYEHLIKDLGIEKLSNHYPNEISQGQKQRVAIARALIQNPDIILCDEPTESLDYENKYKVLTLLKELSTTKVILIASHDEKWMKQFQPYVYAIKNKKLVKKKEHSGVLLSTSEHLKPYKYSNLKSIIKKVTNKKMISQSRYIFLSTLLIFLLTLGTSIFFNPETHVQSINHNDIYVHCYKEPAKLEMKNIGLDLMPILNIQSIQFQNRDYRVQVAPIVQDDDNLLKQQPQKNEIVINKTLADYIKRDYDRDIIGKSVVAEYMLGNESRYLSMKIIDIVEETGMQNQFNAYYNNDCMNELLKQVDYDENKSVYTYMQTQGNVFLISSSSKNLEEDVKLLEAIDGVSIQQAEISQIRKAREASAPYKIVCISLIMILMIAQTLYIVFATYRNCFSHIQLFVMLFTNHISLKEIKEIYGSLYLKKFIQYYMLLLIILMSSSFFNYIEIQYIFYLFIYILFLLLINVLAIYRTMLALQHEKLALSLKQDKDH